MDFPWVVSAVFRRNFKTIGYFSCEYPPNDEDLKILNIIDYPICHSRWGLGFENGGGFELIKKSVPHLIHIPDTVDSKDFRWTSEEDREIDRRSIGIKPEHYVIGNVNRNTSRKDIASTISAFKRVKKERRKSDRFIQEMRT